MNDFFARQEDARRRSGRLVLLFALAVAGVALAVYGLAAFTRFWFLNREGTAAALWHTGLFLWTTAGTTLFVAAFSWWKISELRSGGAVVAMALEAEPVPPDPVDPRQRQLRNVVEEMAIASGVPLPDLFLLEREPGINALAAGNGTNDAVICVTRGALELLSRDELQGVIAHEFSHILNGDMLLNLRLLGWLNGILVISQAGEIMFRSAGRSSSRGSGPLLLIAAALYLIGYIGYFFGQLIKCAVSRQREYLGDAAAVQFTRNPGGLAGALKKIGGLATGSRLVHPRAAEVSHMFFGSALEDAWLHAIDTHPPLEERIRLLEPRFDGRFPRVEPLPPPAAESPKVPPRPATKPAPAAAVLSGAAIAAMLNQAGEPLEEHILLARRLMAGLPGELTAAGRYPESACTLVCGLLVSPDPEVRARQEELMESRDGAAAREALSRLVPHIHSLDPRARLPLFDLALPALRTLDEARYRRLKSTTEALATADGRLSLFEFTLGHLLARNLEGRFCPRHPRAAQIYGIRGVAGECSCVLTALARIGNRDEAAAQAAFARGAAILHEPKASFDFLPATECGAARLRQAFATLEAASPQIKRRLLLAARECLVHDGIVTAEEIELFRAIAAAVDVPVPPWLQT